MNKIKGIRVVLILAFLAGFVRPGSAQKTAIYSDREAGFKKGLDLFEKEEFAAAQHCFENYLSSVRDRNSITVTDADYYSALCATELFHKDAEFLLKKFVRDHPESPRVRSVYFNLGKYNYRKKTYRDAIQWFNKVEIYDLTEAEKQEYYFKRGYSFLERDSLEKARNDFGEVIGKEGKYAAPAGYYYAHILYGEKKYESALLSFQKLEKDPVFGSVVPYYIAQIYYLQKKYDDVISYAPALLDSANTKRAPELARILGEAYFKTNRFKEAIPFLERYHKSVSLNRNDSYELGYAYFMLPDYDKAIVSFKDAVGGDDSLTQNTWYHLGTCYLKKGNKHYAQNAFSEASRLHFNLEIREDALFSFAQLTYELSYSPFDQAINALKQYIAEYPNSPRADEAYIYLVKINLVTRNYEAALKSIESIRNLKENFKPVYQQIAYDRGVELYTNFDYDGAIKLLSKSMKYPADPVTTALAKYWIAEATYQKAVKSGDAALFDAAKESYEAYNVEPGAPRTPMFNSVQYQIGYCLFKTKQYPEAITAFRKYVLQKSEPSDKICNAYIRIGDSYYVTKDFDNAADYYEQAYSVKTNKPADKDYVLYQRAMALGPDKKYDKKIETLLSLMNMYPRSVYVPAAKFEIARTYQITDQPDEAITYYKKVIAENNGSPYLMKCYDQLGLIYVNKNDLDDALVSFKKVVSFDKNSPESRQARNRIREIYEDKKDPAGQEEWDKSQGFSVAQSSYDSLAYRVAKTYYDDGDCGKASSEFGKYVTKYPSGIYILDATFMKAECDLKNKDLDAALTGYNYILGQPTGKYTETSLRRAAAICFNRKDFKPAFEDYTRLETLPEFAADARIGMMRSAWGMKDYDNASAAATKVLTTDNVTPDVANEAHLILARAAMQKQNYDLAYNEYSLAQSRARNENAAEAAYNIAFIQNMRKEYKQAEKSIFELIKQQGSYKEWVGKSFLLLSDNYLALNDTFQAKYVLTNFIGHTEIEELKLQAQDKLNKITEAEKEKSQGKQEKDLTVPMNNERDTKLFDEEKKGEPQ